MRVFVLAALLLLTACTSIWQKERLQKPNELWQNHQKQLENFDRWAIEGRTAIVQGRKGWNAGIKWQQTPKYFNIYLSGPFSQGSVNIKGNDQKVVMTFANKKTITAETAETVLYKALGVHLPVSALHDWVRGIPYKKLQTDSLKYDDTGKLTHLTQAGWIIRYLRYIPFKQKLMPAKIFIKRNEINIRLIIDKWKQPA